MKRNTGFTLIEILVVIAILSGLVAILFPNFMEVRIRARDDQRKSDLKQIQKALESYKDDSYPPAYPSIMPGFGTALSKGGNTYMSKVPRDPSGACSTGNNNYYYYQTDSLSYVLAACLENKSDPEGVTCPQGGNNFKSITGCLCDRDICYTLTNP